MYPLERSRWQTLFAGGIVVLAAATLVVVVAGISRPGRSSPTVRAAYYQQAKAALDRGEFARAIELAAKIERRDRRWSDGRLIAGEAASRIGDDALAITCYDAVPRDGSDTSLVAAFSLGEIYRRRGRLSDAESAFGYVLKHDSRHTASHERMAFLLGITGRRWESQQHFLALIRSGDWDLTSLALVGDLERPLEQADYIETCVKASPDDLLVQAALAANEMLEGHVDAARRFLDSAIDRDPQVMAWQAMLGELLIDTDVETFAAWHAGLPAAADEHPDIWFVRGLRARRHGDLDVAARCFWETVRREPTHRRGTYQLGQVLQALGDRDPAVARQFAERSSQQFALTQSLDLVLKSNGRDEAAMRRTAELMRAMGRTWEAWAWATTAAKFFPAADWPRREVAELTPRLDERDPYRDEVVNLALGVDLSHLPAFAIEPASGEERRPDAQTARAVSFNFVDEAQAAGIEFVYHNGPDPATPGARMFEQTGGGVAVLDYDLDGWPDLYLPQGTDWPTGTQQLPYVEGKVDCFYRNVAGQRYEGATRFLAVTNPAFGQGAAVGDVDSDGFSDLYIANIGPNRLFVNNGDGTFDDRTSWCGLTGDDWTASCVIADLNADGLPDLFDANYVTGPGVYERLCEGKGCSPRMFDGSLDRVHLNRGDGTFLHQPDALSTPTKGLGVVVFWLPDSRRPHLFVTNDQVPNTLFHAAAGADESSFRLADDAFSRGLAFNENGLAMAGMGIAADDADGDSRLDLFVTNFKDEYNTLYLQDTDGLFVDATNVTGLRAPTLPYVGWGTQFLDADLDGMPDLVVVNGHVDDYRDQGGDYQMPPQLLHNTGNGRYVECSGAAGPYFQKRVLGRGLARLDWNGDGRMDFAVSNIGEPASLVTNRITGGGQQLTVRLVATSTARDAYGCRVTVVSGSRSWTKQLVAGGGYMAANERMLQFGLGDAAAIDELRVTWPSGETQLVAGVQPGTDVLLTEGRTAPLSLRRTTEAWSVAGR